MKKGSLFYLFLLHDIFVVLYYFDAKPQHLIFKLLNIYLKILAAFGQKTTIFWPVFRFFGLKIFSSHQLVCLIRYVCILFELYSNWNVATGDLCSTGIFSSHQLFSFLRYIMHVSWLDCISIEMYQSGTCAPLFYLFSLFIGPYHYRTPAR